MEKEILDRFPGNEITDGMRIKTSEWELLPNKNKVYKGTKVNLDLSHRCPLECLRCPRQTYDYKGEIEYRGELKKEGLKKKPVPGRDITMEEFDKITDYFARIQFCGQYSDPIHHPHFIDMLKMIKRKGIVSQVHSASNYKSDEWFKEAFEANPDSQWWFGIDGLPKDSHKYRVHQDGEMHFERLKMARKILNKKPIWQYIVFNYNEQDVETAMKMAEEIDVIFNVINSGRWDNKEDDDLKPKQKKGIEVDEFEGKN